MITGWAILSPLAKHSGWAPGPVGDMTTGSRGWILWVSLAIMCSDSLVALIPVAYGAIVDLMRGHKSEDNERDTKDPETEDRLVPFKWVVIGWTVSVVIGTALVWVVFGHEGIKPWATFIGFLLGGLLSILA